MGRRHVLVTGPGGSGKTTLAHYFQSMGGTAFDADLAGIGYWSNDGRNNRCVPTLQDLVRINAWAEENGLSWYWDPAKLKELLRRADTVYLMGSAKNAYDLSFMFDEIYFLNADENLILMRLRKRNDGSETYHDNGRTDVQREMIVRKMKRRKELALENGFKFVDASLSPEKIFKVISKH